MRSSVGVVGAAALVLAGCRPSNPGFSIEFVNLEDKLELFVYNVAFGASIEVCGVPQTKRSKVFVPISCLLPEDMPLSRSEPIESKPVPIVVKPLLGAKQTFERTQTIDVDKQRQLFEGLFAAVTRGATLPRGKKHGKPGIAFIGNGGVRVADAKRLGDIDIVVRINPINGRDTGKTCSYTGVMTASLRAYDADLEAFDAHTGKKLGKKHLDNTSPGCPSSNYGHVGEHNTVSSAPPEFQIDKWAHTLEPDTESED